MVMYDISGKRGKIYQGLIIVSISILHLLRNQLFLLTDKYKGRILDLRRKRVFMGDKMRYISERQTGMFTRRITDQNPENKE